MAATIVTGFIALHGDRRALIAAVILVASLIAAAHAQFPGYYLAAGMLLGYAGFGVASLVAND